MVVLNVTRQRLLESYAPWVFVGLWSVLFLWGLLHSFDPEWAYSKFNNMPLPEFVTRAAFLPLIGSMLLIGKQGAGRLLVFPPLSLLLLFYTPFVIFVLFDLLSSGSPVLSNPSSTIPFSMLIILAWINFVMLCCLDKNALSELQVSKRLYLIALYVSILTWVVFVLLSLALGFSMDNKNLPVLLIPLMVKLLLCLVALWSIRLAVTRSTYGKWRLAIVILFLSPANLNYVEILESSNVFLSIAGILFRFIAFASHLFLLVAQPPPLSGIFVSRSRGDDSSP